MKRTMQTLFSAVLLTCFLVTTASAQDWKLAADIPFNFNVGDLTMTSGKYTVQIFVSGSLLIRSADNQKAIITLSHNMITPRDLRNGKLVFNAYGDRYFLSTVSWPGGPSRFLPPTKAELEVAKSLEAKRRVEVASQ